MNNRVVKPSHLISKNHNQYFPNDNLYTYPPEDSLICQVCSSNFDKNKNTYQITYNSNRLREETNELYETEPTPEMEEELKCLFCIKFLINAIATCLIEGKQIFSIIFKNKRSTSLYEVHVK